MENLICIEIVWAKQWQRQCWQLHDTEKSNTAKWYESETMETLVNLASEKTTEKKRVILKMNSIEHLVVTGFM